MFVLKLSGIQKKLYICKYHSDLYKQDFYFGRFHKTIIDN